MIEQWRQEYNTRRPHSALGYRPPAPGAYSPHWDWYKKSVRSPLDEGGRAISYFCLMEIPKWKRWLIERGHKKHDAQGRKGRN